MSAPGSGWAAALALALGGVGAGLLALGVVACGVSGAEPAGGYDPTSCQDCSDAEGGAGGAGRPPESFPPLGSCAGPGFDPLAHHDILKGHTVMSCKGAAQIPVFRVSVHPGARRCVRNCFYHEGAGAKDAFVCTQTRLKPCTAPAFLGFGPHKGYCRGQALDERGVAGRISHAVGICRFFPALQGA